jgi:cbb3-type cytochrome oxidase cytochrome c subunit
MSRGPLIFLGALAALAASWVGLVLTPQMQVGQLLPTNAVGSVSIYPAAPVGLARQGIEVYRANGCVYCHSQQVGQTGRAAEVVLTSAGTNPVAVARAWLEAGIGPTLAGPAEVTNALPRTLLRTDDIKAANAAANLLRAVGGKAEAEVVPAGPDLARGWGRRRTVARDYLYQEPVLLGAVRIGPDLANVGLRYPDVNWQLCHLYAPASEVKGSTMPPYRFLFRRHKIDGEVSPDALRFPAGFTPPVPAGYELVPTEQGRALAAYLLSLRADGPLFEAPMTLPPAPAAPATNAPAVTLAK